MDVRAQGVDIGHQGGHGGGAGMGRGGGAGIERGGDVGMERGGEEGPGLHDWDLEMPEDAEDDESEADSG